jgi:hypothetical protein
MYICICVCICVCFSPDLSLTLNHMPLTLYHIPYVHSGFYYLVASERSTYFAWSIMIAMDAIQVGFNALFIYSWDFF